MLVKIIGCHGGTSPEFKNTSYLIDGVLLIDAGSVASGLQISEQLAVKNILISHAHLDHIADLAFLADNCFGLKDSPFYTYCNKPVKDAILKHLMNDVIWPDFSKIPSEKNPTIEFKDLIPEKEINLDGYKITPVRVNHPGKAVGFIVEKNNKSLVFTQDTGPTDRIWELAKKKKNLKGIFTETSFPNHLQDVAKSSQHFTPNDIKKEIEKMPKDVPIFVGHLKPNYQDQLFNEIQALKIDRVTVMSSDAISFVF